MGSYGHCSPYSKGAGGHFIGWGLLIYYCVIGPVVVLVDSSYDSADPGSFSQLGESERSYANICFGFRMISAYLFAYF